MKTNYIRVQADSDQVEVLQARYEGGLDNISFLLQARQQLSNSESAYFRSLTDYQLALRDFHREKGSLLNYAQIGMSESAWPSAAYQDATERGRFFTPSSRPARTGPSVSEGAFDPTLVGGQATVGGNFTELGSTQNDAATDLATVPSSPFHAEQLDLLPAKRPVADATSHSAQPMNNAGPILR